MLHFINYLVQILVIKSKDGPGRGEKIPGGQRHPLPPTPRTYAFAHLKCYKKIKLDLTSCLLTLCMLIPAPHLLKRHYLPDTIYFS